MTNEEAIKIIEVAKTECEWNAPLDYQVAFDMAIEALKAQPKHRQNTPQKQPDSETLGIKTGETCSDAISRQDAIDIILDDKIDDTSLKVMTALGDGRLALTLNDACDRHIRAIEQLPSAQPEQRWIPCSERLPENDEIVLATTAWGEVTIAERIYPPINDTCWFIHDGNTNATIDDVVAWMPLPEPAYMEETNGKNV